MKRPEVRWTPNLHKTLISTIIEHRATLKVKGEIKSNKWDAAHQELKNHPLFLDQAHALSIEGMKKKYRRLKSDCEIKYAISTKGANLSALPDNPAEEDVLMINLIKLKIQCGIDETLFSEKQKKRSQDMLNAERNKLFNLADSDLDSDPEFKIPRSESSLLAEKSKSFGTVKIFEEL